MGRAVTLLAPVLFLAGFLGGPPGLGWALFVLVAGLGALALRRARDLR